MKGLLKIVIFIMSLILAIVLGVVIYLNANQTYMSKASAKQLVENRYDGKVTSIQTQRHDAEFKVTMVSKEAAYHIVIDRKKASIKEMIKTKTFKNKKKASSKKAQKPNKKKAKISQNDAKGIAKKHVGGTFVAIKSQISKNAPHYAVTQHVNQSEGANVMVHRVTGKVTSVSWFTRAGATTQEEHAATHRTPTHTESSVSSGQPSTAPPTTSQAPSTSQIPPPASDDDEGGDDDWGGDD